MMIAYQSFDPCELNARKPATNLQSNRIEPEFREFIIPLDMDVRRFDTVPRVEEEPIRSGPQDCWHTVPPIANGRPRNAW